MALSSKNYTASYKMLTDGVPVSYIVQTLFFGSLITSVLLILYSVVADSEKNKLRHQLQNTT